MSCTIGCVPRVIFSAQLASVIAGLVFTVQLAQAEWDVAAYFGGAHTSGTSLTIQAPEIATNVVIHPVSYATKPFQSPVYYGYRAGYYFNRHFGLEGEFTHLKVYAETGRPAAISGILQGVPVSGRMPISSIVQRFNITHGVNLLTGDFVARKSFGHNIQAARCVLAARIGAGITIPHAENQVFGISNAEHYQVGSPVIQAGAGVELRLWRGLYGIAEGKYTRTNEDVDIAQGTARSLLSTTHLIAGLSWHFWTKSR